MEKLNSCFKYLRRVVLKPENRIGQVYKIKIDAKDPLHSQVMINKAKQNIEKQGFRKKLIETRLSTREIMEQGLTVGDFVTIGLLGDIRRLASIDELEAQGIEVEELTKRFYSWGDFFEDVKNLQDTQAGSET